MKSILGERTPPASSRPLAQASGRIEIHTGGAGFFEISDQIQNWLSEMNAVEGLLTLFICHTSASLTIQENADPTVQQDLVDALDGFAPQDRPYRHCSEGPDDMPAHIKAMLTSTSLSIPVQQRRAVLGTWQGIFVIEHRTRPHRRQIALTFQGSRN